MKRRGIKTKDGDLPYHTGEPHSETRYELVCYHSAPSLVIKMIFTAPNYAIDIFELPVSGSTPAGSFQRPWRQE